MSSEKRLTRLETAVKQARDGGLILFWPGELDATGQPYRADASLEWPGRAITHSEQAAAVVKPFYKPVDSD